MPPTPYEKAKSGWPSAWLTWILTVQQKIKMIALIFFKVVRKSTLVFFSLFLALDLYSLAYDKMFWFLTRKARSRRTKSRNAT